MTATSPSIHGFAFAKPLYSNDYDGRVIHSNRHLDSQLCDFIHSVHKNQENGK
ncbi:hypothetical protein I656_00453 [Geobacillus sp. WSUCF1]|nr:hypothetical protein I656_00453 [Geobacillus sp. WSUCF1]